MKITINHGCVRVVPQTLGDVALLKYSGKNPNQTFIERCYEVMTNGKSERSKIYKWHYELYYKERSNG